jgi:hypothetical protein
MIRTSKTPADRARAIEVKRRLHAKEAPTYDREADFTERWLFGTDHIRSCRPPLWLQWLFEFTPSRTKGESSTRRPLVHVLAGDFHMEARDRLRAGIIEWLVAVKGG